MIQKLLDMLFGEPRTAEETTPVTIQYAAVSGKCDYMISWEWQGHTYMYRFPRHWKSIVLTKAAISHDAARGCFSWDQATYAKELIDAMTEGVK
jgi:hypothetical protein